MIKCAERNAPLPQWYVIPDKAGGIAAGAGLIENDFHDRKDLTPNICALFVEEHRRGEGMAGKLLDFIRKDAAALGFLRLYLVTELTGFYEKYGWSFLTEASSNEGPVRIYEAPAVALT